MSMLQTTAPPVNFVGRPVWAEISLGAIKHNLRAIRKHVGKDCKILAIVKANAYGHGAVDVGKAIFKPADWLGVACVEEGLELRDAHVGGPILVLSGCWPGEERDTIRNFLTPAIVRLDQLWRLDRAASRQQGFGGNPSSPYPFHLKIDTGMNRLGIPFDELDLFAAEFAKCKHLKLEGTFTHFAASEDFNSRQTEQQELLFATALDKLRSLGLDPGIVHMANSAATALRPSTWAHMVRPGALLYGYHQFYDPREREDEANRILPLRPAFSLRSRIMSLREVPAGQGVGYNSRFITERPSRIAVLAAGYADGVVRNLSNRGRVLVRGCFAPIVGTVSMDLTMIDVTDVPGASIGDIVTIFGADDSAGSPAIYANEVARLLGTVTSDLLCSVGRRVPRFYVD